MFAFVSSRFRCVCAFDESPARRLLQQHPTHTVLYGLERKCAANSTGQHQTSGIGQHLSIAPVAVALPAAHAGRRQRFHHHHQPVGQQLHSTDVHSVASVALGNRHHRHGEVQHRLHHAWRVQEPQEPRPLVPRQERHHVDSAARVPTVARPAQHPTESDERRSQPAKPAAESAVQPARSLPRRNAQSRMARHELHATGRIEGRSPVRRRRTVGLPSDARRRRHHHRSRCFRQFKSTLDDGPWRQSWHPHPPAQILRGTRQTADVLYRRLGARSNAFVVDVDDSWR